VKNIIASTYDSVDILIKVIDVIKNGIILVDEFHNLSENNLGNKRDNIYKILNMGIKTIYISATPKEIEHDAMYKFEWKKAIREKLICDFNPTIPSKEVIEDERLKQMTELCKDLRELNEELEPVDDSVNCKKFKKPKKFEDVIEKYIKKAYFLIKSLLYNGNKKCIVFLTTVKKAKMFEKIIEGFMNLLNTEIKIYMITNGTSVGDRESNMYSFRKNRVLSMILNVQILNEGIDIPECDSVFIAQPNKNKDNLIQRMCRCNRITDTKKSCNMYLWTSEKNMKDVLQYIEKNTNEYTRNKINIFDPIKNVRKVDDKKSMSKKKCDEKKNNNMVANIPQRDGEIHEDKNDKITEDTAEIPKKFIEQFNSMLSDKSKYNVDLDVVAEWLEARVENLVATLKNSYQENEDYIVKLNSKAKKKIWVEVRKKHIISQQNVLN